MNELQGLLRRSFEALFGHRLDFEQCAEDIAWLQARKLRGVQALCQNLSRLEQIAKSAELPALSWTGSTVVDASQSSLLIAAPYLVDYAVAQALTNDEFSLQILSADRPIVLIAGFPRIAEQELVAHLQWQDADSNELQEAILNTGTDQVSYRRVRVAQVAETGKLTLHVSKPSKSSSEPAREPDSFLEHRSADKLAALYTQSLRNGIDVPDPCYEKLNTVAKRLLVEASEQSRRGAGS